MVDNTDQKSKRKRETVVVRTPMHFVFILPPFFLTLFWLSLVLSLPQINLLDALTFIVVVVLPMIFAPSFWLMYQIAFVDRLIISSKGIEFHVLGASGSVSWDKMEYFDVDEKNRNKWGIWYEQVPVHKPFWLSYIKSLDGIVYMYSYMIPISYYTFNLRGCWFILGEVDLYHFQKTKLGSAIHYYAPHLFEYDGEKGKGKRHG
jgi:hypothetical protein